MLDGFEARFVFSRTEDIAVRFRTLAQTYSLDLLAQSREIEQRLIRARTSEKDKPLKRLLGSAKRARVRSTLPANVKAMWGAVAASMMLEQELRYACQVYDLPTTQTEMLTWALQAANDAGRLRQADRVRDGREVFDNLSREHGLMTNLEVLPTIQEAIYVDGYVIWMRRK